MSEDLGQLVARVVADQAGFRSDMLAMARTVESNTAKMNASLSRISKTSDIVSGSFRLITRVAGAFGVALSVRALTQFATRSINAAAELHNLTGRMNVTVEALSELQHLANLADVDFQSFTQSLQIMTRNFGEASKGSRSMQDTFRQLGLDFRLLSNMPVDQQLEAVAEALGRVSDEGVRTALGLEVLGRGGAETMRALEGGAAAMRKTRQEARDLGAVTSTEMAKSANEAKDAIDRLKASFQPLINEFIKAAPAITAIATGLREAFFATDNERALKSATRELEDRKRLLSETTVELARYKTELAKHPDIIERSQAKRLEELTHRVSILGSEVFDAQTALDALLSGADSGAPSGGTPTGIPGLIAPSATSGDEAAAAAREKWDADIRRRELALTAFFREQEAQRFANVMEFQEMQQEARLTVDTARLEHDTELGTLLTDQLRAQLDERLLIEQELTTAIEEHERIRLEAQAAAADRSIDITRNALQQELQMREMVANSAVGLLQALGAKHRGAAIAALAIQKGLALAEIKVQTEVAAMRALAELGPIAGPPVAAAIGVRGAISMGLVAATGLIEAAQLSSGGVQSTLGTSANPIATRSTSAGGEAMGSGRKNRVTEIHLHGDIYGWDDYVERRIIDGLRSAVNDREVVIINADSRQGELLGSTA